MPKIFICYRKNDSEDVVGRIYERLTKHFWKRVIFKDVDSIPAGENFPKVIKKALDKAKAVVVVIGPEWINARNDLGKRRLEDPEDFVRLEIEIAQELQVPIIPVLLGNTLLPTVEQLPPSLNFLPFLQSLSIRPDPDFQIDIGRLCGALEKYTIWPWLWVKKTVWIVIGILVASGVLVWLFLIGSESKAPNPKDTSEQKIAFIDKVSSLINERHFGLQRVFWALKTNSVDKANEIWKEYYESVKTWNQELNTNTENIRRLLGDKKAAEFLDYTDELHPDTPNSIHGHFWIAHTNVLKLKECLENTCPDKGKLLSQAETSLRHLDLRADEYIHQANMKIN